MNIQSEIKKEGIDVIKQLDISTVHSISKSIVKVLQNAFPEKELDTKNLVAEISKLNMYVANLPEGCSAKYFYKNKSIYFSPSTSITKINDLIVHECIHYLQERRTSKGKMDRMGFCDFMDSYLPGTGMNEAAVQLLASKCMKKKSEVVSYFGLTFNTTSPNYYPLECALVNQLDYIIGDNVLFDSTFNSNDNFEEQFISLTSAKVYDKILDNLDLLLDKQDFINELNSYNNNGASSRKVQHNNKKIEKIKLEIKDLFFETQNLIIESYFDSYVNLIYSKEALEKYRSKLYNFRNYIATADGYTFYNRYYINKMVELENKVEHGFNPTAPTALILYKDTLLKSFVKNIKSLFKLSSKEVSTISDNNK